MNDNCRSQGITLQSGFMLSPTVDDWLPSVKVFESGGRISAGAAQLASACPPGAQYSH